MIDATHQISEVRRQVGTRVLEAGEGRVMTLSQTYKADIEDVWDACTNPERIPRWFLPVSGELRVGGTYQLEGNAGGKILRCDPPNSFAATWEMGDQVSWIEVRLSEEAEGRVRFELEHVANVDDDVWAQFGPGAVGIGWDLSLMGLAMHLSGRPRVTPENSAAWMASEEGRRFMSDSSDQWCLASIAAGTPRTDARAAAQRCLEFYTGSAPAPDTTS